MDVLSDIQRHNNMRAIRSNNTKIEVKLRKALWHSGVRYRKNYRILGCRADIVITKYRIAVFCDGDFWHGKLGDGSQVKTRTDFWREKINRNMERDLDNTIVLRDAGWVVLRFWESDIKNSLESCVDEVLHQINVVKGFA